MNHLGFSLRDIQYLVTVAETEHFGRAAALCHVSQPALSTQIKKLEETLEVQIFERNNRRVQVTPAGQRVVQIGREILAVAERFQAVTHDPHSPLTGQFKVGAIASLGPYLWPHILAPIKKTFLQLDLFIREGLTEALIQQLRSGALDAVLASPTFDTSGLVEYSLFFEPFFLAAPSDHPLAKQKTIENRDLNAEEMVLLEDGHCLKDQTVDLCPTNRRGHIRPSHATSVETLRQLVATGAGYTLLPALAVDRSLTLDGLLKYRPLQSERAGRLVCLYSRPKSSAAADAEAFAQFLRAQLPKGVRRVG